jgi:site-specific recombinase XerD
MRTVPQKPLNHQIRPREWLTAAEVGRLIQAAQNSSRYPERDSLMLLLIYTHGMRVIEITELLWEHVDFSNRLLHIHRAKRGILCMHPLNQQELNALVRLKQSYGQRGLAAPWVFLTERGGGQFSPRTVHAVVHRAGKEAGFPWPVHPQMLITSCARNMAKRGIEASSIQQFLGYAQLASTTRYIDLKEKIPDKLG